MLHEWASLFGESVIHIYSICSQKAYISYLTEQSFAIKQNLKKIQHYETLIDENNKKLNTCAKKITFFQKIKSNLDSTDDEVTYCNEYIENEEQEYAKCSINIQKYLTYYTSNKPNDKKLSFADFYDEIWKTTPYNERYCVKQCNVSCSLCYDE